MAKGTHFASGVTNVGSLNEMGILREMDPTQYFSQSDDFFNYASGSWTKTDTGTGTVANIDGANGLLQIANANAGANDSLGIQWAGGEGASMLTIYWDSTKDLLMTTRFKLDDATNSKALIGATTVSTSIPNSLPTNGIYFFKDSGATTLIGSTRNAGTSSSITLGSMADATYCTATLAYCAQGNFPGDNTGAVWRAWFNGNLAGQLTTTTNSPTAGLCVSMAIKNVASAVAHALTVDYLRILVARNVA